MLQLVFFSSLFWALWSGPVRLDEGWVRLDEGCDERCLYVVAALQWFLFLRTLIL